MMYLKAHFGDKSQLRPVRITYKRNENSYLKQKLLI